MPAAGDGRRRDADAEEHVAVGRELLERGGRHRRERRRAQLQGEHAGAEAERRSRDRTTAPRSENASLPLASATQRESYPRRSARRAVEIVVGAPKVWIGAAVAPYTVEPLIVHHLSCCRLRDVLQPAQIAAPQLPEHGLGDALTHDAAHPPREAQPLVPAESGPAVAPVRDAEAARAGHDAAVLDADAAARAPIR